MNSQAISKSCPFGSRSRRVVGSTDVHFAEADGSIGRFTGIFDALTPATLKPDDGDAGNVD